ncbi:MAG: hypothetical protein U0354_20925 [Candidatus Sericytochromatia bacterium]
MKTLFKKIQSENTNLSSLVCFIKVLYIKKFNKGEIRKGFNDLVLKGDYSAQDKGEILDFCYKCAQKSIEK